VRTTLKKTVLGIGFIIALIIVSSCGKKEKIPVPVLLPLQEGSQIKYVSYVTDSLRQIQHVLEYIPRYYVRTDSSAGLKRYYYVEKNKLNSYLVDEKGCLSTRIQLDLAAYATMAGFPYHEPISFSYWRPIFKKEEGFGTNWTVQADTQFVIYDAQQKLHALEFGHHSKARLDGWSDIYVPASKGEKMRVLNVHWLEFRNFLYDSGSGDTLWVQRGEGRELFEPKFGLARAMNNYTTRKKGEAPQYRQSTLDLYLMIIPGK
jgi:hypothetical protein